MMKKIFFLCLLLFAVPSMAEQKIVIKEVDVHYSAFNSTFLTPQVATSYQLIRNARKAILSISLLDNASLDKPALDAKVNGQVKNLIGHTQVLNFKKIVEGKAIYYLTEFSINNEEDLRFDIAIDAGLKGSGKLVFSQKFYVAQE